MAAPVLTSILHPTDYSDASNDAFAHALRFALAARCHLHLVHVDRHGGEAPGVSFPHVRSLLAGWKLMHEMDPRSDLEAKLGVRISKHQINPTDTVQAMVDYLDYHPSELIVLGTEGRSGWAYLKEGSTAERIARAARASTLFVRSHSRGLVDESNGDLFLNRALMPIDKDTPWIGAFDEAARLLNFLNPNGVEIKLLHVGDETPIVPTDGVAVRAEDIELRRGPVVDAIVKAARDCEADLIIMPTAGHRGILDAVRGSTTERVVRQAPCPVLAIPTRVPTEAVIY